MKIKRYLGFIGPSASLAEMSRDLNGAEDEIINVAKAIERVNSHGQMNLFMGLVDLRDATESILQDISVQLDSCRLHNLNCDWVGMVHPNDLDDDALRHWVRSECVDFWLYPFQRLRDHLQLSLNKRSPGSPRTSCIAMNPSLAGYSSSRHGTSAPVGEPE